MQYRLFGRTGVPVSQLGFGAMRLPQLEDGTNDIEASIPLLQRGVDLGINYIDTAWVYIKGTNEMAVGAAIKGYDRTKLHLATKIPVHDEETARPDLYRSRLEDSLRRLDTAYIDFIFFHGLKWEEFTGAVSLPGQALDEARRAQSEGLVRHVCFSSHDTTENVIKLIDTGEFAGVLLQYNFLDRHNERAIAHAASKGLGVAIMGPVAGGRLATPAGFPASEGTPDVSTPELALRFVWANRHVSVALSGMNEVTQVEQNVAAVERAEIGPQETAQIERLVERNQLLADLYCTGCGYCMPCPNEVNIPENFRYMNWHRVWGLDEQAREAYSKLSAEGTWTPWAGTVKGLNAAACIQCGECEPKCPQHIPIIEQLKEVAETLGS